MQVSAAAAVAALAIVILLATTTSVAAVDTGITCEPLAAVADQFAFEVYCWDIS